MIPCKFLLWVHPSKHLLPLSTTTYLPSWMWDWLSYKLIFPFGLFSSIWAALALFLWHQTTLVVWPSGLLRAARFPPTKIQVCPVYTIHWDFSFEQFYIMLGWFAQADLKIQEGRDHPSTSFILHYSKKYFLAEKELIKLWLIGIQCLLGGSHYK